ncbi:Synaptophysin / synaptoporin [Aphelenchoides bicaudatus]|nr:Synaptophysin / synaptoporin [Aphelenchoides bicaudatus]
MMADEKIENVDLESNVQKQTESVHVEAASAPTQVNTQPTESQTENGKKQTATPGAKPQSKVSPFTNMHHKLNFIPHSQRDKLNAQFLATLPGVLKIAELVLGFVAFILAICADRKATSSAWAEHITFETTIVVAALLIGYTVFPHLTLQDDRTRNSLVVLELMFYGFNTVAYFIAVWLMVHLSASWTAEGRGAAVMCAILCVALTVLYGIETFVKFKLWKGEEMGNAKSKVQKVGHATTVPGQQYPYHARAKPRCRSCLKRPKLTTLIVINKLTCLGYFT